MQVLRLLVAVVVTAALADCQKERPADPRPAAPGGAVKPFAVKTNDGIAHEFYRGVSLDAFLKQLPSGSVDSLNMNLGQGPQVFALVKVPERPGMDPAGVRFESRFTTDDGQVIAKRWAAAKGRKPGPVTGLFCLPPSVTGGETRILHGGDG